ncbi:MAG: restriction endonuclease subunit S, partial [candidate division WOR-3 bacterium]
MRIEKLKNITTKIGSGATPRGGQNSYSNQGISLIRSQNVLDFDFTTNGLAFINEEQAKELASVTVYENDILLNITGDSIARCCIVPKEILPARVNQHVAIIRCDDTVNSKYVFYYLQYLKPYLLKICGVGGTRNALTKEVIEELEIVIPSNQDDIAEILSSIDNKIQLNKKINTELENLAKTIYNYWFVQFDFPNEEGKPYKTSGGEMVWNEALKREIPKGWKVNLISKHFDYLEGPGITKDKYTTIGHKFINIKCIVDNDLDITEASM